uniref:Bacterial sugar transferase domain-containing protein n=1 Tax=Anopheles coluzzii TaxID=1518534 RepID=A0A8W7PJA3_ANOCL
MTTGEGGMVVSKNKDIIARCKIMRLHGISRDAFDRYVSKTPAWYYEVVAPGFKYNMPDTAAAMGIHQLKKIAAFQQKRELMAARFDRELADLPLILPARPGDAAGQHAWHLYPVRIKPEAGISRDDFILRMAEKGIGCSVHFIPLHRQPVWRDGYQLERSAFPVADAAFEAEVTLPLYTRMSDDDQTRVIAAGSRDSRRMSQQRDSGLGQSPALLPPCCRPPGAGSPLLKRLFDLIAASAGLLLLAGPLLLVALWIKLDSPGPVFFRQVRVGRGGMLFRIHKFRTMQVNTEVQGQLTVGADSRVTGAGRFLRKSKLDELPQLLDVLFGDMSLVGPRPEVPKYVAHYPEDVRDIVLSVRPGITDWASIRMIDENEILGRAADPERAYIEQVLPEKLGYYVRYAQTHSLLEDIRIIFATLLKIVLR